MLVEYVRRWWVFDVEDESFSERGVRDREDVAYSGLVRLVPGGKSDYLVSIQFTGQKG